MAQRFGSSRRTAGGIQVTLPPISEGVLNTLLYNAESELFERRKFLEQARDGRQAAGDAEILRTAEEANELWGVKETLSQALGKARKR